jgi:hypothetical protein
MVTRVTPKGSPAASGAERFAHRSGGGLSKWQLGRSQQEAGAEAVDRACSPLVMPTDGSTPPGLVEVPTRLAAAGSAKGVEEQAVASGARASSGRRSSGGARAQAAEILEVEGKAADDRGAEAADGLPAGGLNSGAWCGENAEGRAEQDEYGQGGSGGNRKRTGSGRQAQQEGKQDPAAAREQQPFQASAHHQRRRSQQQQPEEGQWDLEPGPAEMQEARRGVDNEESGGGAHAARTGGGRHSGNTGHHETSGRERGGRGENEGSGAGQALESAHEPEGWGLGQGGTEDTPRGVSGRSSAKGGAPFAAAVSAVAVPASAGRRRGSASMHSGGGDCDTTEEYGSDIDEAGGAGAAAGHSYQEAAHQGGAASGRASAAKARPSSGGARQVPEGSDSEVPVHRGVQRATAQRAATGADGEADGDSAVRQEAPPARQAAVDQDDTSAEEVTVGTPGIEQPAGETGQQPGDEYSYDEVEVEEEIEVEEEVEVTGSGGGEEQLDEETLAEGQQPGEGQTGGDDDEGGSMGVPRACH